MERLEWVWLWRSCASVDSTELAATSAGVTQQHDSASASVPALAYVRALRFFTHCVQLQLLQRALELCVLGVLVARCWHSEPVRPLLWHRSAHFRSSTLHCRLCDRPRFRYCHTNGLSRSSAWWRKTQAALHQQAYYSCFHRRWLPSCHRVIGASSRTRSEGALSRWTPGVTVEILCASCYLSAKHCVQS
jgi:hypothetical protein